MNSKNSICIVSPLPPPFGGMAVQAEKLANLMEMEGIRVYKVATNMKLTGGWAVIGHIPIARTLVRQLLFLSSLNEVLPKVSCVYFLTGFFNFFFWVTYPALILIFFKQTRVVLSARGGGARSFFQKYGFFVKPVLKRLDAIAVPSGFLREAFRDELGLETVVVPNIADLKQFRLKQRDQFSPKLIVTRSLEQIYDIPTVIRAFRHIASSCPKSRLGIVGDGSQRQTLEMMVRDLGLSNQVTFYGEVTHSQISDIYDQYDIFINASRVDNLPGSVLEAFAAGLPVVSTRAGGIPFMVTHKANGLLADLEDDKRLAAYALDIIENPELGRKLAMKGYDELKKYTWPHIRTILLPLLTHD